MTSPSQRIGERGISPRIACVSSACGSRSRTPTPTSWTRSKARTTGAPGRSGSVTPRARCISCHSPPNHTSPMLLAHVDPATVKHRLRTHYDGDAAQYHVAHYVAPGPYSPLKQRQFYIEEMIRRH